MRVSLDSNVIIYAEGVTDQVRRDQALAIIDAVRATDLVIPFQAVGEILRWLIGKGGLTRSVAVERASFWVAKYSTQDTNKAVFEGACELVSRHALQFWDAVILAASSEGSASVLLSEDMQDGFRWRGVTVANPFAAKPSAVIGRILNNTE